MRMYMCIQAKTLTYMYTAHEALYTTVCFICTHVCAYVCM